MTAAPISAPAAGFPQAPFVDPATGDIATVWRSFLIALWTRTGAGVGVSSGAALSGLTTETAARQAADTVLSSAIAAEATARVAALGGLASTIPAPYTLPPASTTVLGGVMVDGVSITAVGGLISAPAGGGAPGALAAAIAAMMPTLATAQVAGHPALWNNLGVPTWS